MQPVDHLGNRYSSVKEMVLAYGIYPTCLIYKRLKDMGWSLEKALTTPIRSMKKITYKGKTYRSARQLSFAVGIDTHTLERRVARGFTLEEAVEIGVGHPEWTVSVDHLGNKYPSFKAMCKAYKKSPNTVNLRLNNGWSLELALTAKQLRRKGGSHGKGTETRTGSKSTEA